jgi:hypothetical protein
MTIDAWGIACENIGGCRIQYSQKLHYFIPEVHEWHHGKKLLIPTTGEIKNSDAWSRYLHCQHHLRRTPNPHTYSSIQEQ